LVYTIFMSKSIKLALLDFDGTLISQDVLDLLCKINGKEKESKKLDKAFHQGKMKGLDSLIKRINLLAGVTISQVNNLLEQNPHLMPGVNKLMGFFKKHNIITILASGNILPVLKYYQELLGIDYVVGSNPIIQNGTISGISSANYSSSDFKGDGIRAHLSKFGFVKDQIIAIGDSPGDKGMFSLSGFNIAINPKGDIADFADEVIQDDLNKAVTILKNRI
jgi:phosphoserine phosphatase